MAGYVETAARPHVLADLVLTCGSEAGHDPQAYDVFIAAAPVERWASVTCACGATGRSDWLPTDDAYRAVLRRAWVLRACGGSESP